ncbi:MAG: hypothetical protein U1F30_04575 [Steroidobacteraceae bacterium]
MAGEALDDAGAARGQVAGEQAMPLGEGVARGEGRRPDRRLVALGERDDLLPGVIARDSGAGDDHRPGALRQRGGDACQRLGIALHLLADRARGEGLAGAVPVVDGDGDEGGPARRLHRHVVRPGDGRRHVLGPRRLAGPLHVGAREFSGPLRVQEGLVRQDRPGLLAGRDDQRRLVAVGGEQVAERVADAGSRMQVDQRGPARCLGEAVGHAEDHGLLQPQHVAEALGEVAEHRQLGGAGVAEDRGEAEAAQQLEGRCPDGQGAGVGHAGPPWGWGTGARQSHPGRTCRLLLIS